MKTTRHWILFISTWVGIVLSASAANYIPDGWGRMILPTVDPSTRFTLVAARGDHNLAVRRDGKVVAWGFNYYGLNPVPGGLTEVIAVVAGSCHSLALRNDGTVIGWGDNRSGQSSVPSGLDNVIAISAATRDRILPVTPIPKSKIENPKSAL